MQWNCDEFDLDDKLYEIDKRFDDEIWLNSQGNEIKISEMEDNHLSNVIKWIENNDCYRGDEWVELFEEEQDRRNSNMFEKI